MPNMASFSPSFRLGVQDIAVGLTAISAHLSLQVCAVAIHYSYKTDGSWGYFRG